MINEPWLYIGGKWTRPEGSGVLKVLSPITEDTIGTVPEAMCADIDKAVASARDAFDNGPWPRMSLEERAQVCLQLPSLLDHQVDDLVHLQIDEMGSPYRFMNGLTANSIRTGIKHDVELAEQISWQELRTAPSGTSVIMREPVGVTAAIIPWNGPVTLVLGKLLPAIITGCPIIIKPAPETPLDAHRIADAVHQCGFPEGVVSIIPADREVAQYLVSHPGVDRVTFTGSTTAGKKIGAICGEQIKRVTLELGGKSAGMVLEDADLARDVPNIVRGAMQNNGQVCAAITRIIVTRDRYDELVDRLVAAISLMTIGDPHEANTDFGPLVAKRQRDRVEGYIRSGTDEGAKLVLGGRRPQGMSRGWYVEPTVFAEVDNSMRIAREEIFGPVMSVLPCDNEEEAIAIANESPYGLSGAVFTRDPERGLSVARRVRSGTFSVNDFRLAGDLPFGGYKNSGIGREHGLEGLSGYLEYKVVTLPPGVAPKLTS